MSIRKYSQEQFIEACKTSTTVSEIARKLGLATSGGSHASIRKYAKNLNIDLSHLLGRAWNKGKVLAPAITKRPTSVYLSNEYSITNHALKKRLVKENLLQYICLWCQIKDTYNGKPITLELDHIDGNHLNNNLANLRFLCPNCHSQTDTSRSGGKRYDQSKLASKKRPIIATKIINYCLCGAEIDRNAKTCRSCKITKQKIDWPAPEVLIERLATTNYLALGEELGVSDNAIRKYLKGRGFTLPRGWTNPRIVNP